MPSASSANAGSKSFRGFSVGSEASWDECRLAEDESRSEVRELGRRGVVGRDGGCEREKEPGRRAVDGWRDCVGVAIATTVVVVAGQL